MPTTCWCASTTGCHGCVAASGVSGYWSLAGYAKRKVKTALNFIFDFEESAVHHARERGLDGVICGHIHWATMREIDGLTYINCGDWVDSCTAIVEHFDGRLELVAWGWQPRASGTETAAAPSLPHRSRPAAATDAE